MQSGLNGIASGKRFDFNNSATLGALANDITALVVYSDKPSVLGLIEGSLASPNTTNNDPVIWAQKFTRFDNGTDRFAQNIGGGFFGVHVDGMNAAGAIDIDGTWIGLAGNAALANENLGTPTVQDWDGFGSVTGVAAFAHIDGYPGHGNIVTGLWGYPSSPNMSDTTFDNLPGGETFSTCGLEVNIDIRHKDPGARTIVTGHGNSIGAYMFNYRTPSTGVKDWTFGIAFAGSPNDNDFASVVPSNWNGFYTGILIDKIKSVGILMGQYFQSGAYGIKWPTSYAAVALRPSAAMHWGDNQVNVGEYTGAVFNDNDIWHNAGTLFFKYSGTTAALLKSGKTSRYFSSASDLYTRTTSGAAAGTVETGTNRIIFKTFDFDTTAQEFVQFAVRMPKSWDRGTVNAQFVWSHAATVTNFGVVWGLSAVAISDLDAGDAAFGTAQAVADTGGTTNTIYITAELGTPITVGGSPAAGDWVVFQVSRNPGDGNDTMAIDARLHGVNLFYTTNAANDA